MSLRAVKEVRETPMGQEIITSAENVSLPQPPTPKPTVDDYNRQLEEWLKARNVTLIVAARGVKSGQLCSAADFEPDTHTFMPVLVELKNGATA